MAYNQSVFANAWNWVDAYLRVVYGASLTYIAVPRQALMARHALSRLDELTRVAKRVLQSRRRGRALSPAKRA